MDCSVSSLRFRILALLSAQAPETAKHNYRGPAFNFVAQLTQAGTACRDQTIGKRCIALAVSKRNDPRPRASAGGRANPAEIINRKIA